MEAIATDLPGVLILEPPVFRDDRGAFRETWRRERWAAAGLPERFEQDNLSASRPGVLRGLHYQHPNPQGKLVSVLAGAVFDVAVDIRVGSPTFGRWVGVELSAENGRQLWVPPDFAHGFVVTAVGGDGVALFAYKCTTVYDPTAEGSIRWDDPAIGIAWPVASPSLSPKDAGAPTLAEVAEGRLPRHAATP